MVDKSSGFGYAQITSGGKGTEIIYTGRGDTGFAMADITSGQKYVIWMTHSAIHPPSNLTLLRDQSSASCLVRSRHMFLDI